MSKELELRINKLESTLADLRTEEAQSAERERRLEADNAERKKIIEFCQKRIAALEKALDRYGEHDENCEAIQIHATGECNCGFKQVLGDLTTVGNR